MRAHPLRIASRRGMSSGDRLADDINDIETVLFSDAPNAASESAQQMADDRRKWAHEARVEYFTKQRKAEEDRWKHRHAGRFD